MTAHVSHQLTAGRWVRVTWGGWLLGVPFIVVFTLAGELVGIGGAQWLVGAGMAAGLGLVQARVLRGTIERPSAWFWSCVVGLVAGVWQARLQRQRFDGAWAWVGASVAGWVLAAGAVAISDLLQRGRSLRGILGALASLGTVAVGGLLLGLVTGIALARSTGRGAA